MAIGIIGEEKPRYFSIVRWGDADITFEQVKKRLQVEKWMLWLDPGFSRRHVGCPYAWRIEKRVRMLWVRSYGVAAREQKSR